MNFHTHQFPKLVSQHFIVGGLYGQGPEPSRATRGVSPRLLAKMGRGGQLRSYRFTYGYRLR